MMYAQPKQSVEKRTEGWYHIKGQGRCSHYYIKGNERALCGLVIFNQDLYKLESGVIPLYKEKEIFSSWICHSCYKKKNGLPKRMKIRTNGRVPQVA